MAIITLISPPYTNVDQFVPARGGKNDLAIQDAVNAAVGVTNGIYLSYGSWTINNPITLPNNASYFRVLGSSWGTLLSLANNVNDYVFKFNPPTTGMVGVEFKSLKIDCNNPNQNNGGGIYAFGAIQCYFDHLYITRPYNHGIFCFQDGNLGTGHHNRITNCLFDQGQSGAGAGRGVTLQASDENFVSNCDFESCGSGATDPAGIADYSGLQSLINNVFVGCNQGIKVQGDFTHIIGCMFDGCKQHNIQNNGNDTVVVGNKFYRIGFGSASQLWDGMRIDNVQNCTVEGNTFYSDATGTEAGVNLVNGADVNTIVGNTFRAQGSGYGLGAVSPGTGTNNIIRHNKGFVTENSGTASILSGNTSIAVTHGLGFTPSLQQIMVTPTTSLGSASQFWISNPTSTQFTINVNVNPAQTVTFAWQASRT